MRLFIGSRAEIENYCILRESFADLMEAKWSAEENIHLTWIFLGNLPSEEGVIEKLKSITALREPVPLYGMDTFGKPPRVLFAQSPAKRALVEKIAEFENAGFRIDRFRAHVTVARIKKILVPLVEFKKSVERFGNQKGRILPEIYLYRSILTPQGPEYKKIYSVK
jgi:2'-5' RNA ligase